MIHFVRTFSIYAFLTLIIIEEVRNYGKTAFIIMAGGGNEFPTSPGSARGFGYNL